MGLGSLLGLNVKDIGGGVKEALDGVGNLATDIRSAITGEMSPEKKAELELKTVDIEAAVQLAQAKINELTAASSSLFIAGWRPAAGWLGVVGLFYASILQPIFIWTSNNFGLVPPPIVDTGVLITLLINMLGLGGLRTYEKKTGVAR